MAIEKSYTQFQKEIISKLEQGLERSLYGSLEVFLSHFIKQKFDRDVFIISEQSSKNYDDKKIGIPDIAIKEKDLTVGYIEVKLPSDSLDHKKFQNQFSRYRDSLENIIFTNLKEWQLWQWNEKEESVKHQKTLYFDVQNFDENNLEELQTWLQPFLFFQPQPIKNTQQLAKNLAKKTKLLTTTLVDIYEESEQLKNVKSGFETTLLHSISPEDFAGIIAETLTYSLFVAGLEHLHDLDSKNTFDKLTLTTAIDYIPENIPVLHDLYQLTKNSTSKNHQLAEVLEQIINQLNNTDLVKIRDSFFADSTKTDPILYFYEDFLSEIDSSRKKKRGVYYTPKPLVDFIVGGVDFLLENKLKLNKGLLNQEVKLLDPATGTGTFLVSSLENIVNKINNEMGGTGLEKTEITKAIKNHFIPNFFALEFLVSSYTIAHLKLSINLQKIGYSGKERINIYLANTLDNPDNPISQLVGLENITNESKEANKIKKDKNIIAVIGNPPYSGSSQNPSKIGKNLTYIGGLIEDYKKGLIGEKNPKWIQDDYVKFIRFAHKKIDEAGQGVVGYVVPHGFLDNPTFRIMRKKLLESFDEIYIVDLHGNNKKKETALDGTKDENVFNIEQGVCVLWMVKSREKNSPSSEMKLYPPTPKVGLYPPTPLKGVTKSGVVLKGVTKSGVVLKGVTKSWVTFKYTRETLPMNNKLIDRAKEMVKNMPLCEKIVWNKVLSSRKTGYKWIKQRIVDNYILDFFCFELMLCIEIDGDSHFGQNNQEYDKIRTYLINNFGIKVVRYTNEQVLTNIEGVFEDTMREIKIRKEEMDRLIIPPSGFVPPNPQGGTVPPNPLKGGDEVGGNKLAKVFHHDLFGRRKEKIDFLSKTKITEIDWQEVLPQDEMFYFIPRNYEKFEIYKKFWSVKDIFEVSNVGIVTAKDAILIGFDEQDLKNRLQKASKENQIKLQIPPNPQSEFIPPNPLVRGNMGDQNLSLSREMPDRAEGIDPAKIQNIAYRPFDNRKIYYDTKLVERARTDVMQHFLNRENLGLITNRNTKIGDFTSVLVGKFLIDSHIVDNISYFFPLYTYNTAKTDKNGLDFDVPPNPLKGGDEVGGSLQGGAESENNQQKIAKLKGILGKLKK